MENATACGRSTKESTPGDIFIVMDLEKNLFKYSISVEPNNLFG